MANFENVPVQLTGFEMENSTMLWSVFISEVGRNIKVCQAAMSGFHVNIVNAVSLFTLAWKHNSKLYVTILWAQPCRHAC